MDITAAHASDHGPPAPETRGAQGGVAAGKRTRTQALSTAAPVQRKAEAIPGPPAGGKDEDDGDERAEPGGPADDPFGMHLLGGPVQDGPSDDGGGAGPAASPAAATAASALGPASHQDRTSPSDDGDDGEPELDTAGDGGVSDAPTERYIVPFDRSPLAAAGERIICRAEFTGRHARRHELTYTAVGGHFDRADGPATKTIRGLVSGNVDFFVPTPWNGTDPVTITLELRKRRGGQVLRTETWAFGPKTCYPTTMTQQEGTGEVALPGVYRYAIGPARDGATAPFYQHQTILERFDGWSISNITPADIQPRYRRRHHLESAAAITNREIGPYHGNNGTFTVNAADRIADQHGGHPDVERLARKLVTPKDIEIELPQTYEAEPGVALGRYLVTRVRKTDGTWKVKKAPR